MTHEQVVQLLEQQTWKFAKTMPQSPHWYTLATNWASKDDFVAVVKWLHANGTIGHYFNTAQIYFEHGGYKYWFYARPVIESPGLVWYPEAGRKKVMGIESYANICTLINRAEV